MAEDFTSADIIKILKARKQSNQHTVLVLGSRASTLFSSQELYETLKLFGNPSFGVLPQTAKFGECYQLLKHNFNDADIDILLNQSLKNTDITDADICLAELVQAGIFDSILTACVDNTLEQALEYVGLRESHDFEVINLYNNIAQEKPDVNNFVRSHIIKVFGDLTSKEYTVRRSEYLAQNPHVKQYLEQMLDADLMMIGIDPLWDAELYRAVPTPYRGSLWYINEEKTNDLSFPCTLQGPGEIKYLLGNMYNYRQFVPNLYNHYLGEMSDALLTSMRNGRGNNVIILRELRKLTHEMRRLSQSINDYTEANVERSRSNNTILHSDQDDRTKMRSNYGQQKQGSDTIPQPLEVFISYVARDEALLNDLLDHLSALKRANIIHEWYSRKVQAGQVTQAEINRYLQLANIILLLVSASFMASEYIHSVELQQAMSLHASGKARVIPIIIRPCDWQGTAFSGLKSLPENGQPVTGWPNQDNAFLDIVRGIREVADALNKN
jgi:hypothetical protein